MQEIVSRKDAKAQRKKNRILKRVYREGKTKKRDSRPGYHNSLCRLIVRKAKEESMVCDICGKKGARSRHVTRSYGKKENLLVIENIPIVSCPHCGECYLTA